MIFRTGSVLIVGMCDEYVLQDIYQFLKALLKTEFKSICVKLITAADLALKEKKKKIRRKTINILTGISDQKHISNNLIVPIVEENSITEENHVLEESPDQKTNISSWESIIPVKKQRKPRKSNKKKECIELEIMDEA